MQKKDLCVKKLHVLWRSLMKNLSFFMINYEYNTNFNGEIPTRPY